MRTILIVEDDAASRTLFRHVLEQAGHTVVEARDGREAAAKVDLADLVLTDLVMPGRDGWSVLTSIRRDRPNLPVVIVSGLDETSDEVRGLEMGADDYLVKPVHPSVLSARVEAVLRRAGDAARMEFQGLTLDRARREVTLNGEVLHLTPREFDVLAYLAAFRDRVVSRDELHRAVWGGALDDRSRAVDVCVASIRRKLDDRVEPSGFVATVRGAGYRFLAQPEVPLSEHDQAFESQWRG